MLHTSARRALLLLAGVLLLPGCASVAEVTGTASQDEVMQLRTDVARLQESVRRLQSAGDPAAAAVRAREQFAQTDQQLAALARRLDGLTSAVAGLGTRVDELSARVEHQGRQARGATPPPARPAPSTSPSPGASAPGTPTPGPPPPGPPVGGRPATGPPGAQDLYQHAYLDYSKGSYAVAITGFREFLRRHPEHPLASNAQYWIAESYMGLARGHANAGQQDRAVQTIETAVQEFKKVVANYPRGEKAPAALYKEALALLELRQPAVAQARLQYLVDNFPQAEEAPLARERLAVLKDR